MVVWMGSSVAGFRLNMVRSYCFMSALSTIDPQSLLQSLVHTVHSVDAY